jgi:hypothetical protein
MNTARKCGTGTILTVGVILMTPPSRAADVYADAPPPAPRIERAPPPRDGYLWGPGHWVWNGKSYFWADGSWVVQRRHMLWVPDQWEQVGEKWHLVPAHWKPSP